MIRVLFWTFALLAWLDCFSCNAESQLAGKARIVWDLPGRLELLGYEWVNDTELVFVQYARNGGRIGRFDMANQKCKMLDQVNLVMDRANMKVRFAEDWSLSNSHEMLLVRNRTATNTLFCSINIKNAELTKYLPLPEGGNAMWLPDDSGLVYINSNYRGSSVRIVRPLLSGDTLPIQLPFRLGFPLIIRTNDSCLVAVHASGDILYFDFCQALHNSYSCTNVQIKLQTTNVMAAPALSRDGQRLAWIEPIYNSRTDSLMQNLFIADCQNKQIRFIGNLANGDTVSMLRWAMDGQSLSFLQNRRIYLIRCK